MRPVQLIVVPLRPAHRQAPQSRVLRHLENVWGEAASSSTARARSAAFGATIRAERSSATSRTAPTSVTTGTMAQAIASANAVPCGSAP